MIGFAIGTFFNILDQASIPQPTQPQPIQVAQATPEKPDFVLAAEKTLQANETISYQNGQWIKTTNYFNTSLGKGQAKIEAHVLDKHLSLSTQ